MSSHPNFEVTVSFFSDIHINRPHAGQMLIASRLRALLDSNVHPSQIRGMVAKDSEMI